MVAKVCASLRRRAARLLKRFPRSPNRTNAGAGPERSKLTFDLAEGVFTLRGRSAAAVGALELVARGTDAVTSIPLGEAGTNFAFSVDVSKLVVAAGGEAQTYNVMLVGADGLSRRRVGNFATTTRPARRLATSVDGVEVAVDITEYGNLALVVGRDAGARLTVATLRAEGVDAGLALELIATSARDGIDAARVRFRGRQTESNFEVPLVVSLDDKATPKAFGRLVYNIRGSVDAATLMSAIPATEEVVDVSVVLGMGNAEERVVRVSAPTEVIRGRGTSLVVSAAGVADVLVPYATERVGHLSYHREQFGAEDYAFMMRRVRWWPLMSLVRWFRPVWLIGEVPHKAQDNGMHMFRYIRTQHPRQRAYYVIDHDSPDLDKVADLGNVVFHRSREHIRMALRASRFAGSHHAEYLYPSRDPRVVKAMRGVRIFMRHGIAAMKNMTYVYGRATTSPRSTERFIVCSERERSFVVGSYGYRRSQVAVTGFARFDVLLDDPPAAQPTVIVMPTWRGDLMKEEVFLASDYFAQWRGFLLSPRLEQVLGDHSASVTLLLHPNMRKFAKHFEHPQIRQIHLGEADVQQVLRAGAMLITDMSSVAWDFSFLRRPVAFFLFDEEKMTRNREAHIDLMTELPGPVVKSIDALCDVVEAATLAGFVMTDADYAKARVFLDHNDLRNRERVYRVIRHAWQPNTAIERVRDAVARRENA